jgi:hypothetical protein
MVRYTLAVKIIILIVITSCGSYRPAKDKVKQNDTCEFIPFIDPYPLLIDTLSDTLSIEDSIFIDELIVTDPNFCKDPRVDSAYVYKNADFTFYIEYYFKSKTITYFLCEGYIRKRQLIRYEHIQNQ